MDDACPCGPSHGNRALDAQFADVAFAGGRANGDLVLFQRRSVGSWMPVTARQSAADVRSLAAGFLAAGLQPAERVALLAATSYEWTLVDYALWTVAAVPVPTRETLTAGGRLRTGDLGALDEDGFPTISGRKKELIVTADGKNLAPAPLEDRLRAHPLISQAVVVGDQRPYAAALITLDAEALASWKRAVGRPEQADPAELRDDPELLARLQTAVEEANKAVSRAESVRRFRVLPVDLTELSGYLTPTLMVKRALIHKDFALEIEDLYR